MQKRVIEAFLLILFMAAVITQPLYGQQTRVQFGKNRMQYEDFNWRFFSSTNFDIYFYGKGEKNALEVTKFLEAEFERITEVVGYSPYFKTKIFLYNSVSDLQQSNMGVNSTSGSVGGQTNFVKSFVEVANPGTMQGLKENLVSAVAGLVINDMMFGGSLTDMWQNTFLMNLPDWFVSGAATYLARGWDVSMDDDIRDLISSGKIKKLNKLTGDQAVIAGQSLWNYIVEVYGKSNLNQVLNLVRVTRNEEKSISFTLGISFKQVLVEWEQYYTDMVVEVSKNYVNPNEDNQLLQVRRNEIITSVALSPDGNKLAYSVNQKGRFHIYINDLNSGKKDKIMSGGLKVIDQEADKVLPLLNWSDDNTLGVMTNTKGQNVLILYDLVTKSKLTSPLRNFDQINSFDFSGNGRLAVLSATRRGKTDIFLLSVRRNKIRRITNDNFDDTSPRFIPGTNTFLFSSNRTSDSLKVDQKSIGKLTGNFNLFSFNLDTTRTVLARITNTISNDFEPIASNLNTIYYLSDQKGIVNIFRYSLQDGIYKQVTSFSQNIRQYDLDFANRAITFSMMNHARNSLYYKSGVDFNANVFTRHTPRQEVLQAKFLNERRLIDAAKKRSAAVDIVIKIPVIETVKNNQDSTVVQLSDTTILNADSVQWSLPAEEDEGLTDIIDTDDYVFDAEVTKKVESSSSFLSNYRRTFKEPEPIGPLPYENRFSASNMVTSWVIDPIRGFGILLQTEMNDMLENHKFYGGVMATYDLKSGDVYAEYQYLKYLVDYSIRFDRNVWFINDGDALKQRYSKNKIEIGASLPFTQRARLSIKPFFETTRYQDLNFLNLIPNTPAIENNATTYMGVKSQFVYDNSIVTGLNMIQGTRIKVEYQHHESINDKSRSFDKFTIDIRHYQKLHRTLVLAARVYYGKFFGRYKHSFLLGGMDNWMFGSEHASLRPWYPQISQENNELFFTEHVTSLRGFDFNTFNGTDVLLLNVELRLPVVGFFSNSPVRSAFLKNLQFVGFLDVGSAWTGISPFNSANNISTVVRGDNIFRAEIQTFRSPWLTGYGAGLRSIIFGYFMKFDLAWPIEDNSVGNTKFYVTLGHDF